MKYTTFFLVLFAIPGYAEEYLLASTRVQESIIVIGKKSSAEYTTDLAGSVDVVTRDQLEYEHVNDTLELFNKIPGVYFSRFNQGIINTDIAIRGFAGEGSTPHSKLLIDGIPANLHNGYGELDQLFPLAMESIQVFKGTSDPRYGLFNLAGNYQVQTRSDTANKIEATLGSYDTRELQTYIGRENGQLQHSYFFGYRESGGYRDHTDLQKYSVSGRWFYELAPGSKLGLIARQAGYDGDAPGYLSQQQAKENPTTSADYANQDGGNKTTRHLSLHFDKEITQKLNWQIKAYGQFFERERWLRFSAASALQNRYDEQDHYGALTHMQWQVAEAWAIKLGADYEKQDILEQRFSTLGQSRERDVSAVQRNFDYDFVTRGAYVQVDHSPNQFLSWNIAVRGDQLDGDFLQRAANGTVTLRQMYDFGTTTQPKLNLFIVPIDQLTLFAHYGRSFQHPFGADIYTSDDTRARDVSINDGAEVGFSWEISPRLTLRTSYWEQHAKKEFVVVDGTPQSVGRTRRHGADFGLNWHVSDEVYFWANYAMVDARIRGASADSGNNLRGIPNFTSSFGLEYAMTNAFSTRLHLDSQGGYHVNEANLGGTFGGYTLLGASFDYATSWGNLNLQVNNLTDGYFEYVYDLAGDGQNTIHSPGNGRNVSASISYEF
jgi:Outer membrane receptor proteins, mostly Fe transport